MKILYKKGLALELWHDFYLGQPSPPPLALPNNYTIADCLNLIPSEDSVRLLRNLRWVFRPQPAGANLFVNVTETGSDEQFQPVVSVSQPYRLTFWLTVKNSYFLNYTNLPLADVQHQIYYFSNQRNNQQNGTVFLSQPLPTYASGEGYPLGQLVSHGDLTLEALRSLDAVPDEPNPDDWETLPASQYVSGGDRLPRQKRYWKGEVLSVRPGETVRLRMRDGNGHIAIATDIAVPDGHLVGAPLPVSIDLVSLSPGRYQLLQQEEVIDEFVFAGVQEAQTALALVEIFLNSDNVDPDLSPIRLQNPQTILQPQTYVIRFKNRATRWRYLYQRPHGCDRTNLPETFTLIDELSYATTRPVGLQKQPDRVFVDCQNAPLPSPTVSQIKPETDANRSVSQIFSDVFL